VNVLKCILVQKVGFLKYKSGLLHGHKMKISGTLHCQMFAWSSHDVSPPFKRENHPHT